MVKHLTCRGHTVPAIAYGHVTNSCALYTMLGTLAFLPAQMLYGSLQGATAYSFSCAFPLHGQSRVQYCLLLFRFLSPASQLPSMLFLDSQSSSRRRTSPSFVKFSCFKYVNGSKYSNNQQLLLWAWQLVSFWRNCCPISPSELPVLRVLCSQQNQGPHDSSRWPHPPPGAVASLAMVMCFLIPNFDSFKQSYYKMSMSNKNSNGNKKRIKQ